MRISIRDRSALRAVTPGALSAYARSSGWNQEEPYRKHSDVYIGEGLPDIIVPRTERLGDYASVVADLIDTFADVTEQDQLTVYRSLVTADRDVILIRAGESRDGSIALDDGVSLIGGTRDLLLAAACSLDKPKAVYRPGENQKAADLVKSIQLGQTAHGSFVVTLLTPVVPPRMPALFREQGDPGAPDQRRFTPRLMQALSSMSQAAERAVVGDVEAFVGALESGVSANLCEALVRIIKPFPTLDIRVMWARTRPENHRSSTVRFRPSEVPLFKEAARLLRAQAPRPDETLVGFVRLLPRDQNVGEGTIRLSTSIGNKQRSVQAELEREDYERAVQAHKDGAAVEMSGDLERIGQRWRLLRPELVKVILNADPDVDDLAFQPSAS